MRIQLWSYNYDPEPSGIAPLSGVWARAMQARGHRVDVVAAHPHYPKPIWGTRAKPYRERRDGVSVLRLPLWIGRDSGRERIRQEASFAASLSIAAPVLGTPDVIVAVTPSFPALLPAMVNAWARRIPWIMWLQDILPDGAAATGLVESGALLDMARRFERVAYASASRVVVISEAFERNLLAKGVPADKLTRIYNPSGAPVGAYAPLELRPRPARLLVMGNIGYSQGLAEIVAAIDGSAVLTEADATLRIAGHGVAEPDVSAAVRTDRVELLGLLLSNQMERELAGTTLGIVTQRSDVAEFNLPSKLMNYMAHSLPVLAVVKPESECARIVRGSGAGWVADAGRLDELPAVLRGILANPAEMAQRGWAAHRYAAANFDPRHVAAQYEREILSLSTRGNIDKS